MSIVRISQICFRSHDPDRFCQGQQNHLGFEVKFLTHLTFATAGLEWNQTSSYCISFDWKNVRHIRAVFAVPSLGQPFFYFMSRRTHFRESLQLFHCFSRRNWLALHTRWGCEKLFFDQFVNLPQLNTVFTCGFYQLFTQTIVMPGICRSAYGFSWMGLSTFTWMSIPILKNNLLAYLRSCSVTI